MRLTLPANSSSSAGRTYFLSPQIRRLRQGWSSGCALNSVRRCGVASLTVSTVWNGSFTRNGNTRLPLASYFPSQRSSVVIAIDRVLIFFGVRWLDTALDFWLACRLSIQRSKAVSSHRTPQFTLHLAAICL